MSKIVVPEVQLITEFEEGVIRSLKDNNQDLLSRTYVSQSTYLRFIRGYANEQDYMNAVHKHFREYLQWRIENRVDELSATPQPRKEEFVRTWPHGLHGISKDQHIVYIDRPAKVNPSTFSQMFSFAEYERIHIQTMELLCDAKDRLAVKLGRHNYKHVVIMDLDGFTMSHFSKKFYEPIKRLVNIDQSKYPETLHKMFIVNYPFLFKAVWTIVSPWIDPITKSRIEFCKVKELLQYIDADQLPSDLGGTRTYTDENPCFVTPFQSGGEYDSIFANLLEGRRQILIEHGIARQGPNGELLFRDEKGEFNVPDAPPAQLQAAAAEALSVDAKEDDVDPALLAAVHELKIDGGATPVPDTGLASPVILDHGLTATEAATSAGDVSATTNPNPEAGTDQPTANATNQ